MRPESEREAKRLTDAYASAGPEILQRDFYNSLPAAFDAGEVRARLESRTLSPTNGTRERQARDRVRALRL